LSCRKAMVETSVTNRSRASASVYTVCHPARQHDQFSKSRGCVKTPDLLSQRRGGTDTNLGDNALKQLASLSIRHHATAIVSAGAAF
jgi:hypothetical protein